MKIEDKFLIENAKSLSIDDHEEGAVPFISNGTDNKGVIGFVKPIGKEKVFLEKGICVSSFCEVSVHTPPFLPRGNGGSGLIVLIPKEEMTEEELYLYATQIKLQSWRFSFSRMVINQRIRNLPIVNKNFKFSLDKSVKTKIPKETKKVKNIINNNIQLIPLVELCNIERKSAKPEDEMDKNGRTPYVTTSSKNNGVSEFVNEKPNSKGKCLTVALNGSCGETFFQFDDFITSGDNATLTIKGKYNPYLLLYVGFNIYKQKWGFNYYRKLSESRLRKIFIPMPMRGNQYDLNYIEKLVKNCYGFGIIKKYL